MRVILATTAVVLGLPVAWCCFRLFEKASTNGQKSRQSLSSAGTTAVVKESQVSSARTFRDTYVSGSANVQFGDRLYFEDRGNALQQDVQRLQDSLNFSGMHARYEALREAADQTYSWILNPDLHSEAVPTDKQRQAASFLHWFHCGSDIFWVSGKPGSGKSTLMKYLAEHIALDTPEVDQPNLIVLSYFFWINGDDLQCSKIGCMRSLLWQLLQHSSTMTSTLQICHLHFKGTWTERVLRTTLSAALDNIEYPTAVFLDGLDESSDHDDTLAFLTMFKSSIGVKLCVSSRPEPAFVNVLSSSQNFRLQDLNAGDIQQFIKAKFLDDPRFQALAAIEREDLKFCGSALEDLASEIRWKSEGVFLWVHLVIKDLLGGITKGDDLSILTQRLHRLPIGIYALYKDMLNRTLCDHELYKDMTALFLTLALHGPSVIEFCFAANEDLRKKYLCPSIFGTDMEMGADIDCEAVLVQVSAYTAGLLEVDKGVNVDRAQPKEGFLFADRYPSLLLKIEAFHHTIVDFFHRTAIDFLRNTAEGISLLDGKSNRHADIVQTYLEAKLIGNIVLPSILGQSLSVNSGRHIFNPDSEAGSKYIALKRQGHVLNNLYSAGVLLPDSSTWMVSTRNMDRFDRVAHPFPSSAHAFIDLVPLLIEAGEYEIAQMWLDDYECVNDVQYLTKILVSVLGICGRWGTVVRAARPLCKALIDGGADLHQNLTTELGESILPIGAAFHDIRHCSNEALLEICDSLNLTNTDLSMSSFPCCYDCHQVWFTDIPDHWSHPVFELWGSFCTVKDRDSGLGKKGELSHVGAQISRTQDDRVFVIARAHNSNKGRYPQLWRISERDSQLLVAESSNAGSEFMDFCGLGILTLWKGNRYQSSSKSDGLKLVIERLKVVIDTICARSPILTFVAAMERLGKSQETIQKFYATEAERMAREHPCHQLGWKEWYWGKDAPPGVDTSGPI